VSPRLSPVASMMNHRVLPLIWNDYTHQSIPNIMTERRSAMFFQLVLGRCRFFRCEVMNSQLRIGVRKSPICSQHL